MNKLNKILAMSLATLTLAGSSSSVFAARTKPTTTKTTAQESKPKGKDYTSPQKETTDENKLEQVVNEIFEKIKNYENSHICENLNEIYDLVDEHYLYFNVALNPLSGKETVRKVLFINDFMTDSVSNDVNSINSWFESADFSKLSNDNYFIRVSKIISGKSLSNYAVQEFFTSEECKKFHDLVEEEQKRLAKRENEIMQEKQKKQNVIMHEVYKIFNPLQKRKGRNLSIIIDDKNSKSLYDLISSGLDIRIDENSLKIGLNSLDKSPEREMDELEKFLFEMIQKDLQVIAKHLNKVNSSSSMIPFIKNSYMRIGKLYLANQNFKDYVSNYLKKLNGESSIKKFETILAECTHKKTR